MKDGIVYCLPPPSKLLRIVCFVGCLLTQIPHHNHVGFAHSASLCAILLEVNLSRVL